MNSPYAAPDTPIASAKRARVTSLKVKSPSGKGSSAALQQEADDYGRDPSEGAYDDHKENVGSGGAGAAEVPPAPVTATPSKNLFSPTLRTADGHHHPPHDHYHRQQLYLRSLEGDHTAADVGGHSEQSEERHSGSSHSNSSGNEVRAAAQQQQQQQTAAEENSSDDGSEAENVDDDDEEEFNPYQFIASLPAHETVRIRGKSCLPPRRAVDASGKQLPTLVLDLDETLVHCTVEPIPKPDLVFPVTFNGCVYQVYVRKRPYLDYFLETVSKSFEVVVFTASQSVYADVLLDKLDPGRKHVQHRLFREACLLVQGNYLKDLTVINRDLKQSVLVDNSPHAYSYQTDNGIPIESWYDDDSDTELLKLIGFLKQLQGLDDFRPVVRNHFKTYQLVENARKGLPTSTSAPPF